MGQQKLSISVPATLAHFVERYRDEHGIKTKSAVIERALELLREHELERAYAAAAGDSDPAWDATLADGLPAEDWS